MVSGDLPVVGAWRTKEPIARRVDQFSLGIFST